MSARSGRGCAPRRRCGRIWRGLAVTWRWRRRRRTGGWTTPSGRRSANGSPVKLGLDGCAWVAVRHDDYVARDGREHVHLLAVAVTGEGDRWNDSLVRRRAIQACREIEAERGLTVADAPERRGYGDAATPQAARRAARREGEVPDMQRARAGLERAIDRCDGTWTGLERPGRAGGAASGACASVTARSRGWG